MIVHPDAGFLPNPGQVLTAGNRLPANFPEVFDCSAWTSVSVQAVNLSASPVRLSLQWLDTPTAGTERDLLSPIVFADVWDVGPTVVATNGRGLAATYPTRAPYLQVVNLGPGNLSALTVRPSMRRVERPVCDVAPDGTLRAGQSGPAGNLLFLNSQSIAVGTAAFETTLAYWGRARMWSYIDATNMTVDLYALDAYNVQLARLDQVFVPSSPALSRYGAELIIPPARLQLSIINGGAAPARVWCSIVPQT